MLIIDVLSNGISFFCYIKNEMEALRVFKSWGSTIGGNMHADDGFFKTQINSFNSVEHKRYSDPRRKKVPFIPKKFQ